MASPFSEEAPSTSTTLVSHIARFMADYENSFRSWRSNVFEDIKTHASRCPSFFNDYEKWLV